MCSCAVYCTYTHGQELTLLVTSLLLFPSDSKHLAMIGEVDTNYLTAGCLTACNCSCSCRFRQYRYVPSIYISTRPLSISSRIPPSPSPCSSLSPPSFPVSICYPGVSFSLTIDTIEPQGVVSCLAVLSN